MPNYLVIGASGGIGSEVSRRLAQAGATVFVAGRSMERLEPLVDEFGGKPIVMDATIFDDMQRAMTEVVGHAGAIDGVVNCVGSILLKPAHLTSVDEYLTTISLNLNTAFYTVKAAARIMMTTGGSIVLFSSAVARTGLANHEAIAAAKAGIVGLTQSAAATYGKRGIRVNCVAPGLVETPLTARLTANESARAHSEGMHALGRLGRPGDIAEVVQWLLDSERSGWVTGQCIGVDGGLGSVRP